MHITTYSDSSSAHREKADILIDRFGRRFNYLRIAVTDKCNLRCVYCMPDKGINFFPERDIITTNEILRIIQVAARLGIAKIRFTGGEPLLRCDIIRLVREANKIPGIQSIHLTTNGQFLEEKADFLKGAGLHGINISLDTLNETKYRKITRRGMLSQVMKGLEKCIALGFSSIKINVVALRGFNDDELLDFVEFTQSNPITVRFIELMPFSARQIVGQQNFYQADRIITDLKTIFPRLKRTNGSSTEQYVFTVPGHRGKIAVIPAYSRDFCSGCTRVRVTADGKIRNCLYSPEEYNLKELINSNGTDQDIANLFKHAMWFKLQGGRVAQYQGVERCESMTQIGG